MARLGNAARRIDTDALKRERPLADVVASYGIALRRESAGTFRALCPFHQEHTPSFWIDARDGSAEHYFCFGCTAHGDVITFDPVSTGNPGWIPFLRAYNDLCSQLGGVPLFNQTAQLTRPQVDKAFGERIATFRKFQQRFDPNGRLVNAYFRELLSG